MPGPGPYGNKRPKRQKGIMMKKPGRIELGKLKPLKTFKMQGPAPKKKGSGVTRPLAPSRKERLARKIMQKPRGGRTMEYRPKAGRIAKRKRLKQGSRFPVKNAIMQGSYGGKLGYDKARNTSRY